jgi:hypothetical protein
VEEEKKVPVRRLGATVELGAAALRGVQYRGSGRTGRLPGGVGRPPVHDEHLERGRLGPRGADGIGNDPLFVEGRNHDGDQRPLGHATPSGSRKVGEQVL